jgi:hypothetical protein
MTVSLQSTFGSAFVGLVASAMYDARFSRNDRLLNLSSLYGVTILQTYVVAALAQNSNPIDLR